MDQNINFEVFSHDELVGWSAFEHRDPSMGVAFGRFLAAPGYSRIQNAVRESLGSENRVEVQKVLGLSVRTPEGLQVRTENGVSIADASKQRDSLDIEIEMLGVSNYDQYFSES